MEESRTHMMECVFMAAMRGMKIKEEKYVLEGIFEGEHGVIMMDLPILIIQKMPILTGSLMMTP